MRALVTGAGGFLGRALTRRLLDRGYQVRAFARGDYPELGAWGVECVRGDLRDPLATAAACHGTDIVFHTAAVAGIWGKWQYYYDINTLGTYHVVAGCRQHHVPRLVYTSSPSVTFDGSDQCGVDESVPYPNRWLCHYPHTKALAEQHVLQAADESLRTCALRPHLIWGAGDPHLIPRLLARARSGRLRQVGEGANLVDVIHVDNAALAHVLAGERLEEDSNISGRAYFVSQSEPVNCWDWINEILSLAGIPAVRKRISFKAAWRLGAACEFAYRTCGVVNEPPMTRFLAAQLAKSHYFDTRRAQNELQYYPELSTDAGMRALAQSLTRGGLR